MFDLPYPYRLTSIAIIDKLIINGILACRPMMVKCIPFNPTTDPCAQHADILRFYHVLAIKDFIPVGFIGRIEKTPSDVRKYT